MDPIMKKELSPSLDAGVLIVMTKNQFLSPKTTYLGKDVSKGTENNDSKMTGIPKAF